MKKKYCSQKGYVSTGPIAQVSISKGFAFFSGQISVNPETQAVEKGNIKEQTHRVLTNIKGILSDMDLTLDSVVRTSVHISDMDLFDDFNEVYAEYFGYDNPPARETVVAGIWGGLDVEIGAIVELKE